MDTFVARQPIFHTDNSLFAYELLFRDGWDNRFPEVDGDVASAQVIVNSFLSTDIESIVGAKLAFVNITRGMLLNECIYLLPSDRIVLEILEDVPADAQVIQACRRLKQQGYLLALDDFVMNQDTRELAGLADIIKIDFRATPPDRRRQFLRGANGATKFLAEKIESEEEVQAALAEGFKYLQGYYFSKPKILARKEIPPSKLNYINLLREVWKPELDVDKIEPILKHDLSLCHNLLRMVNSAAFGLIRRVDSIRQTLVLLGEESFRKWVSLLALAEMGRDKPPELVVKSLVRASFCQKVAEKLALRSRHEDLFLMGMFSLIDAILDLPLEKALAKLPFHEDVKSSILGEKNELGAILSLVRDYETGNWDRTEAAASTLKLAEADVVSAYQSSVQWVDSLHMK